MADEKSIPERLQKIEDEINFLQFGCLIVLFLLAVILGGVVTIEELVREMAK